MDCGEQAKRDPACRADESYPSYSNQSLACESAVAAVRSAVAVHNEVTRLAVFVSRQQLSPFLSGGQMPSSTAGKDARRHMFKK